MLSAVEPIRPLPQRAILNCQRDGMHLCRLTPDALVMVWPWMRARLLRLKGKNSPTANWTPEHVRQEIAKGFLGQSATECFVAHDGNNDEIKGFIVAYPLHDPFLNVSQYWFVWFCSADHDVLVPMLEEFRRLGVDRGYLGWRMHTSREGWLRRCGSIGGKVQEYVIGGSF